MDTDIEVEEEAPVEPTAPRIKFALAPGLTENGVLDYSTPSGAKTYRAAVQSLQEDAYNCEPQGLKVFLACLEDRALTNGWETILDIPADVRSPDRNLRNLIHKFGQITLEQVQQHSALYVGYKERAAQDSMQLYQCLMNSISSEAKAKVMIWKEQYYTNGYPSGATLLKVIIRESHIDTRATVRHIRGKLSALDLYIPTIGYDIVKFNTYVKDLMDSLYARGETTQDLLANVFKAYKAASDRNFVEYIRKKEDQYDEGEDINVDMLMLQASNKYKTMVQQGTWAAPSSEEEKIIALEAKIKQIQSSQKKSTNSNSTQEKSKGKDKGNSKKGNKKRGSKPAWMTKPPSQENMTKSKTVDNKEYWWCTKHKSWGRHKASECKGLGVQMGNKSNQTGGSPKTIVADSYKQKLKLSNALEAVMDSDEE
jgi:hypothetical protein